MQYDVKISVARIRTHDLWMRKRVCYPLHHRAHMKSLQRNRSKSVDLFVQEVQLNIVMKYSSVLLYRFCHLDTHSLLWLTKLNIMNIFTASCSYFVVPLGNYPKNVTRRLTSVIKTLIPSHMMEVCVVITLNNIYNRCITCCFSSTRVHSKLYNTQAATLNYTRTCCAT